MARQSGPPELDTTPKVVYFQNKYMCKNSCGPQFEYTFTNQHHTYEYQITLYFNYFYY